MSKTPIIWSFAPRLEIEAASLYQSDQHALNLQQQWDVPFSLPDFKQKTCDCMILENKVSQPHIPDVN